MKDEKNSVLLYIAEMICVIVLTLMTLICFANVVSRYVLHLSIAASEEITTNMFVVLSLVGAALAAHNHQHVGLNLLTDRLSERGKLIHNIFEGVVGMIFSGYLSWYGYLRVRQQMETGQRSAGLELPVWIYGLLCLIGFLVVFSVFAEIMIQAIFHLVRHDYAKQAGNGQNSKEVGK